MVSAIVLALALAAQSRGAAEVRGIVLDPQDLVVSQAHVSLTCARGTQSVEADQRGRFTLAVERDEEECDLTVTSPGFASWTRKVSPRTGRVTVRLSIAPSVERVTVSAKRRSLFESELRPDEHGIFPGVADTADLLRHARALGGLTTPMIVYVDGLPANEPPPLAQIERVTINADPFSAEHAEGDQTVIQIVTRTPDRRLRIGWATDALGFGGQDILGANLRATTRSAGVAVAGPVPYLPLTFGSRITVFRSSNDVSIQAAPLAEGGSTSATVTSRGSTAAFDAAYTRPSSVRAKFSVRQSRSSGANTGVGGLVVQEAGFASSYAGHDARAAVTATLRSMTLEGNVFMNRTAVRTRANSDGPGLAVRGVFAGGGAAIESSDGVRSRVNSTFVMRWAADRPVTMGVEFGRRVNLSAETPNRFGVVEFAHLDDYARALAGDSTGTLLVTRGDGMVHYTNVRSAVFAQTTIARTDRAEIGAGVRVDTQAGFGSVVSPRISAATTWRGFHIVAGGGLFVRHVDETVVTRAIARDGRHLTQFIATGAPLAAATDAAVRQPTITMRFSPDVVQARELVERISIDRTFGRLSAGVEYTSGRENRLLGADRRPAQEGWTDVIESNRARDRDRVHTQLRFTERQQTVALHYEWVRSRDNTDGPFSFPQLPGEFDDEWARSAGLAPHHVSVIGMFQLPGKISVSATDRWNGRAPFNVTTGFDRLSNGLATDRGGLPRNSGKGPGFHSLSLYAFRRLRWPGSGQASTMPNVTAGLQADNLLGVRNYFGIDSVMSSPMFGRPIGSLPGRSVRLIFNVD